jgi:hypothetical protein
MSLKEISNAVRDCEECHHCRFNPEATKPFLKRTDIPLEPLTKKLLAEMSKESGLPEDCCMCFSVRRFLKLNLKEQFEALKRSCMEGAIEKN